MRNSFIDVSAGFKIGTQAPIDSRMSFATIDDMKACDQNILYPGLMTFVEEEGLYYSYKGMGEWEEFKAGGGGGSAFPQITVQEPQIAFSYGEDVKFFARITSPNKGACKIHYKIINLNDRTERTVTIPNVRQGTYTELFVNKDTILPRAEYQMRVYGEDSIGIPTQDEFVFTFKIGSLEVSSQFRESDIFSLDEEIEIPYTIDCVEGDLNPITAFFTIDGTDTIEVKDLLTGQHKFLLPSKYKKPGQTIVEISCQTITLESSPIIVKVQMASEVKPSVIVGDIGTYEFAMPIEISYKVIMMNYLHQFEVFATVDGNTENQLEFTVKNNTIGYMSVNTKPALAIGNHTLSIYARAINDHSVVSDTVTVNFEVVKSSFNRVEPVMRNLWFWYDAEGKTNTSGDRAVWEDLGPTKAHATLHNFNFESNGWMKDEGHQDTYLKLNGNTYCEIPIKPFATNFRGKDGFTMEVLYRTRNIGDVEARVMDCCNDKSPFQGVYINADKAHINSKTTATDIPFREESWTHITYQVSKKGDFLRMLIFVNGVVSKIVTIDAAEDYTLDNFIYLNTKQPVVDSLGTHTRNQGSSEVRLVRGYDTVLSMDDIVNNYISTISDLSEQKAKYDLNAGGMDTVVFYGDVFKLQNPKDPNSTIKKMDVAVRFTGTKSGRPGWYREKVSIAWQGTSTLVYPVKNYKLKIDVDTSASGGVKDDHEQYVQADDAWYPEKVFTMKADYMESSHASNTGGCNFAHDLYTSKLPPGESDDKIRSCIAGFPVQLLVEYQNDKGQTVTTNMGIYQFNLDKNSTFTLGFENAVEENGIMVTKKKENCFSFEVGANDDIGAGAFKKWDEDSINKQWEVRYAWDDTDDDKPGTVSKLRDFIQWVGSSTDEEFKKDAHLHLDLGYTLDYLLMTYTFGMVDNLGKNMMMSTWDLEKFYPCFYDLDTIMGTDNFGALRIEPDGDITGGFFFNRVDGDDSVLEKAPPLIGEDGNPVIDPETGKEVPDPSFPYYRINVFNTSSSELWRKIRVCFKEELKQRYTDLRDSGKFSIENIMKYFDEQIPQQIGEKYYNDEYKNKYEPYPDHLFRCNGNKVEIRRRWITERVRFVDSVFAYGDAGKKMVVRVNANRSDNVLIGIKTVSPMLITIDYGNDDNAKDTIVTKRCSSDSLTTFRGRINTDRDREVSISFSPEITEIGNLHGLKASGLQITYARKLTNLNVSNNQYLKDLSVANNPSLREINCSNCGTLVGKLDVSGCINLKTVNCSNTNLTNLQLVAYNPDNPTEVVSAAGSLQELIVRNSKIRVLDLLNQAFIKEVDLTGCQYLSEISLQGCSQIAKFELTGSTLRTFKTNTCVNLAEVNLSGSASLEEVNIGSSPALKRLNIYKCSSSLLTTLDLLACPSIEYLNANEAGNLKYIRLPQNTKTLKELYVERTPLKGIGYGVGPIPDIVDLDGLPLQKLQMYRSGVAHVKNIDFNVGTNSTSGIWNECGSLHTIEGKLKFGGSMGSTFRGTQMANFPTMDVSAVTDAGSAFQSAKITTAKAKEVLSQMPNLSSAVYMFNGCSEMKGEMPSDMLSKNTLLSNAQYMFQSNPFTSIHQNALKPLANLRYANYMFNGCGNLASTVTFDFLSGNKELLEANYMFNGTKLVIPVGRIVNDIPLGNQLLMHNTKLRTAQGMFAGCNFGNPNTTPKETTIPGGMFKNNTALTNLRAIFQNTNISGIVPSELLSGLTSLTDVGYMFYNCKGIGGQIFGDIFATNSKLINADYMLSDTTATRELPAELFEGCPNIANIKGMFRNTQIWGQIPPTLFDKTNHKLTDISYLFEGCSGIKGTEADDKVGITGYIPAKLFHGQTQLRYANGVFKNCKDLNIGVPDPELVGVPSELFKHSPILLEAAELFMGCTSIVGPLGSVFKRDGVTPANNQLLKIQNMLRDCSSLSTAIPESMFLGCESVIDASGIFRNCRQMKSVKIPENLFGIPEIPEIPPDLVDPENPESGEVPGTGRPGAPAVPYLPKVQTLAYFFEWCNNMYIDGDATHEYAVPPKLLHTCYELNDISGMFKNCGLKGPLHPDTLRLCSKLTNVSNLFYVYYSETESGGTIKPEGRTKISGLIPGNLFSTWGIDDRLEPVKPKITNFSGVFAFNNGLTALGSGIFDDNAVPNMNFNSALDYCSGITGAAPKLWESGNLRPNITGTQCFRNCNFSNQADIPTNWK